MSIFHGKLPKPKCNKCQTELVSVEIEPKHTAHFFNINGEPHVAVIKTDYPFTGKYVAPVCPNCDLWKPCTGQEMAWLASKTKDLGE